MNQDINIDEYDRKNVLILGYGVEGKATKEYLEKEYPHMKIGVADQKEDMNYLSTQSSYDLVIKTPGIPQKNISKPYTTATNIFFCKVPKHQIIGVTGTKGKSTTASLIAHILKGSGRDVRLVGNIGVPALKSLLTPWTKNTLFVYELSSYQLSDIHFSPHISVVVSLFPDHMNYHGSYEKYISAKRNILSYSDSSDLFIYNSSFSELQVWAQSFPGKKIPYGRPQKYFETTLVGTHNQENIMAAYLVCQALDISDEHIRPLIQSFKALPHRLEYVATVCDIAFYDDAISTTPESTIAALRALSHVDTIFLGGENRGYDFHTLVQTLEDHEVKHIVLFPDSGEEILNCIKKHTQYHPSVLNTKNMKEAVSYAISHASPGSICLLSTASPSYSLWKNFIEKGNEFAHCVKTYEKSPQKKKSNQ